MYSIRLRNLFQRCTVVTRKRASSKADSETIMKASELLEREILTPNEFLEHIAQMKSQKIAELPKYECADSDSDEEVEVSSSVEPSTPPASKRCRSDVCIECNVNARNVVFLPCAHSIVCNVCCKWKEDKTCNTCNAQIASHIVIRD